eukprot:362480-Chlamydomonas_euryale.AAC.3
MDAFTQYLHCTHACASFFYMHGSSRFAIGDARGALRPPWNQMLDLTNDLAEWQSFGSATKDNSSRADVVIAAVYTHMCVAT